LNERGDASIGGYPHIGIRKTQPGPVSAANGTHPVRAAAFSATLLAGLVGAPASLAAAPPTQEANATTVVESVDNGDWGYEITTGPAGEMPDAATGLASGQSMVVDKKNGDRVEYVALATSCTASMTASQPYKGTWNGGPAAIGTVSFSRGSGCSNDFSYTQSYMERDACGLAGCNWRVEASDGYGPLAAGTSVQIRLWKRCGNTNSDRWRTGGKWGGGYINYSTAVWLNCGM
jgi:hypothetical protein